MKTCLCRLHDAIRCDLEHCDIAGPGEPFNNRQCRVCWLRLGGDPGVSVKPLVDHGPGTELTKLLASLGVKGNVGCQCPKKAAQMNGWGIAGCKERRDEIAGWLRENAQERSWLEKAKATLRAVALGIAFELDMSDLFGSLVDLAIKRAEEAEAHNPDSRAV